MKTLCLLSFFFLLSFSFSGTSQKDSQILNISKKQEEIKRESSNVQDSINLLQQEIEKTKQYNKILERKKDSLNLLNKELKGIMKKHTYKVYSYKNPEVKLIYKWVKDKKQNKHYWKLVKTVHL